MALRGANIRFVEEFSRAVALISGMLAVFCFLKNSQLVDGAALQMNVCRLIRQSAAHFVRE